MAFHNNHFNHFTDQQHQPPLPPPPQQQEHHFHESTPPNWLLRSDNNFLNLHTPASAAATSSDSPSSAAANQWLSRSSSFLQRGGGASNNNAGSGDAMENITGGEESMIGENARHKAEILSHPLYEQLLSAHVACLRIATPVDQLPRIDAQLAQSQNVVAKYSTLDAASQGLISGDEKELDHFMSHYVLLLCSFKEQLQQHVRVHAMEAVMACWEIEQSLQSFTG
ncbi:unnamed protein product [Brassica napus]|nr:unnamed protein product [Brassica napus]